MGNSTFPNMSTAAEVVSKYSFQMNTFLLNEVSRHTNSALIKTVKISDGNGPRDVYIYKVYMSLKKRKGRRRTD